MMVEQEFHHWQVAVGGRDMKGRGVGGIAGLEIAARGLPMHEVGEHQALSLRPRFVYELLKFENVVLIII